MSNRHRVGVIGARGHTGAELLTILDRHPDIDVTHAGSRELAGKPVPEIAGLAFEHLGPVDVAALELDALVLALPDGVGAPFTGAVAPETVIIDISFDHRLDDSWVYGLPELNRSRLKGAKRIANPGCYATVAQLVLDPFVEFLNGTPVVFGVSGFSGAGTTPSPKNDPERLHDNLIPYKLVGHNHEREASHHLGHAVRFMPHVHPVFRGLLVTVHIPLATPLTIATAIDIFEGRYGDEALIEIRESIPELRDGTGIRGVVLGGIDLSADGSNLVVVGAEDNLLKGAAVQAIQNLNLALGHPEMTGLT